MTTIFTTNKPLPGWGRVLHNEDLAHAIIDRLLGRVRMLTLHGSAAAPGGVRLSSAGGMPIVPVVRGSIAAPPSGAAR